MSFNPEFRFNPDLCRNESEVESKLIVQYLLPALGYSNDRWYQEVAYKNVRFDFLAFATQKSPLTIRGDFLSTVVIEAKHPKENLDDHVRKLRRYLTQLSVRYGLLTNGKEIRIYERKNEEITLKFSCFGWEIHDNLNQIKALIGRENLKTSNLSQTPNEDSDRNPKNNDEAISIPKSSSEESDSDRAVSHPINLALEANKSNMKTIAIYHNKGGVGKTTTVIHLAAAFRKKRKRVLIIDMDSQANTTFATGLVKFDDEKDDDIKDSNIFHVLMSEDLDFIPDIARKSQFTDPEIDVVPSHIMLMESENDIMQQDRTRLMLKNKLAKVKNDYDIVLIDTPPSLNVYARIALISADYLLIPSDLKPFANQGLSNVKNFVKDINTFRQQINFSTLDVLGLVACNISTNSKFIQHTFKKRLKVIPERYGLNVLEAVIYNRDELAKCTEQTQSVGDLDIPDPRSIFDYRPDSKAAQEFELLAMEVLNKIGVTI
ncbi:MAG: AAA family ATPase [Cyanobacteria bacterium SBLK]|nr:AAA family ATPase [Cyanobacteria bacterium SBLK]